MGFGVLSSLDLQLINPDINTEKKPLEQKEIQGLFRSFTELHKIYILR